jgi:preprotein translocase subunit SecB
MKESEFKFLGYRISFIECNIQDNFGKQPEKISQSINIENNFSIENSKFVEVVLNVEVKSESNNFSFKLKIKGGFQASNEMSDDLFKNLAKNNAPAILYPFARSIITSYTAQANIPPVILPTVNFTTQDK